MEPFTAWYRSACLNSSCRQAHITFNPLREAGLVELADPLSPVPMLTGSATTISAQYHQVKVGERLHHFVGIGTEESIATAVTAFFGLPSISLSE